MAGSALHSVPEEQGLLLHKQATEPKGGKGSSEVSTVAAGPEASSIVYSRCPSEDLRLLVCVFHLLGAPVLGICVLRACVSSIVLSVIIVLQCYHFLVVH